jgi:hypothetical protein
LKLSDTKSLKTLDGDSLDIIPTPSRIDLKSIDDVRLEMARVYREIEAQHGTRLVYVLAAIAKAIEVHDIEQRIILLEEKNNGNN